MKRTILFYILAMGFIPLPGQISITADSLVISKWDLARGENIPVTRISENMSLEIDKDLMTLRVFGKEEEKSYIEKAYLIELLEVNNARDKWLFQASDKNCIPYTITLDLNNKRVDFITIGKEYGIDRHLSDIYYTITDYKINEQAIDRHLKEKGFENRR
jgi:hypothetical protein